MALTTYNEIQSAIAAWMSRDDLTARIPDFITMMEARTNRMLRTPDMEFRATLETTAGDEFYALPSGFRGMRSMRISSISPKRPLEYMTPQAMNRIRAGSEQGRPSAFTIQSNELRLAPVPDTVYTLEMNYHKGVEPLAVADSDPEKWLLLDHPDIYIHGPLMEAQVFIQRDQRVGLFEQTFQQRIEEIKAEAKRTRHSAGPLTARPDFTTP